jgi:hypothetical protein
LQVSAVLCSLFSALCFSFTDPGRRELREREKKKKERKKEKSSS